MYVLLSNNKDGRFFSKEVFQATFIGAYYEENRQLSMLNV